MDAHLTVETVLCAPPPVAPATGFEESVRAASPRRPGTVVARLWRGVAWNALGSIIAQGGSFLSCVLLARLLGKQSFGQFALIQNTLLAMTNLAGLGLGITATKYVSEYRTIDPDRAGRVLGLASLVALAAGILFSAGLVGMAGWLTPAGSQAGPVTLGLRVSAIYVFFTVVNGYQVGALTGLESFRAMARINVVYGLSGLVLTGILTIGIGLQGAVLAMSASAVILWLQYHFVLQAEDRASGIVIRYRGAWRQRIALVRFSVPATVSGMIGSLSIWWCSAALVKTCNYAELGVFGAVNNMRLMIMFFPALVARVTSPLLNHLLASGDLAGYRRTFWGAVAVNGGVALALAGVLALAARWILRLFGKDFVGSPALIMLLLASAVMEVAAINLYQAIFTARSLWLHFGISTVWAALLVSLSTLTVGRYGAAGLAFSYLVAWTVSAAWYGAVAWKRLARRAETP